MADGADVGARWEFREDAELSTQDACAPWRTQRKNAPEEAPSWGRTWVSRAPPGRTRCDILWVMRCPGVLGASHLHPRLMAFAPPGRDKRTLTDTSTPHLLRHRRPADGARISYSPNLPNVPGVPGYLRQHSRHHSPSDGSAPTRHLPCPCTISRPGGAKDDSRGWSEAWRAGAPGCLTGSVAPGVAPWRGARGGWDKE